MQTCIDTKQPHRGSISYTQNFRKYTMDLYTVLWGYMKCRRTQWWPIGGLHFKVRRSCGCRTDPSMAILKILRIDLVDTLAQHIARIYVTLASHQSGYRFIRFRRDAMRTWHCSWWVCPITVDFCNQNSCSHVTERRKVIHRSGLWEPSLPEAQVHEARVPRGTW